MRSIKRPALLATTFLGLFAGAASAQERVVAKVPFPFVVRGEEFPVGRYEIRIDGDGVVSIRGTDNKSAIVALSMPADGRDPLGEQPSLVFTRHENVYRLSQIWEAGTEGQALTGLRAAPRIGRTLEQGEETYVLAANWK